MRRVFSFVFAVLLLTPLCAKAETVRVLINPLITYNAPEIEQLGPGLITAVAGRMAGEGYRVETEDDGSTDGLWWTATITVTRLGSNYSVDGDLKPRAESLDGGRAFQTAQTAEEVFEALEVVAEKLREVVVAGLGPQPQRSRQPAPVIQRSPAVPILKPSGSAPKKAKPTVEQLVTGQAGNLQTLENHRVGDLVDEDFRGVVAADLDGDGVVELVALGREYIYGFNDGGHRIAATWKVKGPERFEPKQLSAADTDGDGRVELFVAGAKGLDLITQAYIWTPDGLATHGRSVRAYLRAFNHPENGVLLLGMRKGRLGDVFSKGVRKFAWNGASYEEGDEYPLPETTTLANLDFLKLGDKSETLMAFCGFDEKLVLATEDGRKLYTSDDEVMGTHLTIEDFTESQQSSDEPQARINGATLAWMSAEGKRYLIYHNNDDSLGRLFSGRAYDNGSVGIYEWDGLTLIPRAKSVELPGFIVDMDIVESADGSATLYLALVTDQGLILTDYRSMLLSYNLR